MRMFLLQFITASDVVPESHLQVILTIRVTHAVKAWSSMAKADDHVCCGQVKPIMGTLA